MTNHSYPSIKPHSVTVELKTDKGEIITFVGTSFKIKQTRDVRRDRASDRLIPSPFWKARIEVEGAVRCLTEDEIRNSKQDIPEMIARDLGQRIHEKACSLKKDIPEIDSTKKRDFLPGDYQSIEKDVIVGKGRQMVAVVLGTKGKFLIVDNINPDCGIQASVARGIAIKELIANGISNGITGDIPLAQEAALLLPNDEVNKALMKYAEGLKKMDTNKGE